MLLVLRAMGERLHFLTQDTWLGPLAAQQSSWDCTYTSLAGTCQEQQLWQYEVLGKALNPVLVLVGFCADDLLLLPFDI